MKVTNESNAIMADQDITELKRLFDKCSNGEETDDEYQAMHDLAIKTIAHFVSILEDPYRAPDKHEAMGARMALRIRGNSSRILDKAWNARVKMFKDKRIPTPHMTCDHVTIKYPVDYYDAITLLPPFGKKIDCYITRPYGYDDDPLDALLYNRDIPVEQRNENFMIQGLRQPGTNLYNGLTAPPLGDIRDITREIFRHAGARGFNGDKHLFEHYGYITWPEFWRAITMEDIRPTLLMGLHDKGSSLRALTGPLGEPKLLPEHIFQYFNGYQDWLKNMKRREDARNRRRAGRERQPALEHQRASKAPRLERGEEKDAEDMDE
jgi:hypothetical protein